MDRKIALRDLHSVYESLFLRSVTSFEAFLEELFIAILDRRVKGKKGTVLRMKTSSTAVLLEILLQGDKYMDWLPFSKTEERAKLYLKDGKPFCDLSDGDRSTIKKITTIRHAIAHASNYAKNEFQKSVIGNLAVLKSERKPAGFLRGQFRANPAQNRFESYIAELGRIAKDLC
ncbi:MAG TPA: hypothetical protein VEJ46_13980 [Candidatus Acidoferrum sp.]|nr:hypothetical protein [Candidatus Acidoferrum sp.]